VNRDRKKKLWIGIAVLVILTPLGLLATGTAYAEWGSDELQQTLGYVPEGVAHGESLWSALLPGYSVPGLEGSFLSSSIGYILSAITGIALIYIATLALGKFISK